MYILPLQNVSITSVSFNLIAHLSDVNRNKTGNELTDKPLHCTEAGL